MISEGCPVYIHSLGLQGIITDSFSCEHIAYTVQLFTGDWAACPDWDVEVLH
jgi:hypothetical protein